MVVIGLSILGIFLLILGLRNLSKDDDWCVSIIVGAILVVAMMLATPAIYQASLESEAELESFYEACQYNYAYAVEEAEDVLTIDSNLVESYLIGIEGSVEKMEVGKSVTQLIAEARDAANEYNTRLAVLRARDRSFITFVEYTTPSPELKFIKITP